MTTKAEQKQHTNESICQSLLLLREHGISGRGVGRRHEGRRGSRSRFYGPTSVSKQALIDARPAHHPRAARAGVRALDTKPEAIAAISSSALSSAAHRDDRVGGCPLPPVVGEVATTAHEHATCSAISSTGSPPSSSATCRRRQTGRAATPRSALLALMYGGLSLSARRARHRAIRQIIRACRAGGLLFARAEPGDLASAQRVHEPLEAAPQRKLAVVAPLRHAVTGPGRAFTSSRS